MRYIHFTIIVFTISAALSACNNNNKTTDTSYSKREDDSLNRTFNIDTAAILKDFSSWYNYTYFNISLSQDFIGLDINSTVIDKLTFLNTLLGGSAVAFKIRLQKGQPIYKLYKINPQSKEIASAIQHLADLEMKNYKMEGKPIPPFNFTDLNGMKYSNTTTRGKIVVLKCWFIRCVACVKEFPDCNKLVNEYSGRNDILFISLATDKQKDLETFLQKEPLAYVTVPETFKYISEDLDIIGYPTHLLIDKNGIIKKVVTTLKELKPFLKREVGI